MATKTKTGSNVHDSYLELVRKFPLESIKTDDQLREACAVIDSLLKESPTDEGREAYLDALSDLVARYEDRHCPIPAPSDADMLRHLIEAKGVTQADVARGTGISRSTISEILSGRRSLSKSHIRKLAAFFRVPPGVFLANL